MAYSQHTHDPRRRATAIAGVAVVHTALALALLSLGVVDTTGLEPRWKAINPTDDPDPIPLTPPPPPPRDPQPTLLDPPARPALPQVPAPLDPVERPVDSGPAVTGLPGLEPARPARPTPTPTPSPGFTAKGATPANLPASWISTDDYPAGPLRREIEGVASYHLRIGADGRVANCEITVSTGNRELDLATCRLITRRARFEAATDGSGATVAGSYDGKVRWDIPD